MYKLIIYKITSVKLLHINSTKPGNIPVAQEMKYHY